MKRLIALGTISIAACVLAAPASGHAPGTKYFVGKGDSHKAKVAFRVSKGKVKNAIVDGRDLVCKKRTYDTFFYNFDSAKLDGTRFYKRRSEKDRDFLWAGHVRGDQASGRLEYKSSIKASGRCNTTVIRWDAKTVSKRKWQKVSGFKPA